MSFGGGFGTSAVSQHNPNKDAEVNSPPTDSVSSLCFSPKANLLVATSWDNHVRCWEVVPQNGPGGVVPQTTPKAAVQHANPVLCSTWHPDGGMVFSAGEARQVASSPSLSFDIDVVTNWGKLQEGTSEERIMNDGGCLSTIAILSRL